VGDLPGGFEKTKPIWRPRGRVDVSMTRVEHAGVRAFRQRGLKRNNANRRKTESRQTGVGTVGYSGNSSPGTGGSARLWVILRSGYGVTTLRRKEARIHQFASRTGKDTAQVVEEAIDRMLEYDARFLEAVEEGRAAARRGDLVEHDEVVDASSRCFVRDAGSDGLRQICMISLMPMNECCSGEADRIT
jgi:predicted transcriptional regulator